MKKYRGENIPEQKEGFKLLKKIHFLIHPGFLITARAIEASEFSRAAETIFLKYAQRTSETKQNPNEMVFAFAYSQIKSLKNDIKSGEPYTVFLNISKKYLGSKLVILQDNPSLLNSIVEPGPHMNEIASTLRRIANARGYDFDNNTFSEAYGELLFDCVDKGAGNLNTALKLKNKTEIDPNSSFGLYQESPEELVRFFDNYSRLLNHPDSSSRIKFKPPGQLSNL